METVMDYYPFGAEHHNPEISTQPKPRYRYSGKEEAESYYQYSPYTYCANNPTNLIDPDGEEIWALGGGTFNLGDESIFVNRRLYSWFSIGSEGYLVHLDSGIKYGEDGFSSPYLDALTRALNYIMLKNVGNAFVNMLVDMAEIVVIRCETDKANLENKYHPNSGGSDYLVDKVYTK